MKFQSKLTLNLEADQSILIKSFLNSEKPSAVAVQNRTNSIEEIEIIDNSLLNKVDVSKTESRKRPLEESVPDNSKKVKLSGVSHLQLMQDVVALIDDLINKVCEMASENKENDEEVTIISSDENDDVKAEKKKDCSEPMIVEVNGLNENEEKGQNSAEKEGVVNPVGGQVIPEEENLKKTSPKLSPNEEGQVRTVLNMLNFIFFLF